MVWKVKQWYQVVTWVLYWWLLLVFGSGGSGKVKIWPRMGLVFIYFWPGSLLEAPKWVKDP